MNEITDLLTNRARLRVRDANTCADRRMNYSMRRDLSSSTTDKMYTAFISESLDFREHPTVEGIMPSIRSQKKNKLRGLSPQANYTDRATAAC
jgi:hypothetical protein